MIWAKQHDRMVRRAEAAAVGKRLNASDAVRKDARPNSLWPLLGAIWDKETGKKMGSHRCGPNHEYRYYFVVADRSSPRVELMGKRKFFPAEAVERAVVQSLAEVLKSTDNYKPIVQRYAAQRAKAVSGDVADLAALRKQLDRLREKKAFTLDEYGDLGPDLLKKKIAPMTTQIAALEGRIAVAEQVVGATALAPDQIVNAVVDQMQDVLTLLGEPSTATLRSIIKVFTKTVVDRDKREAEIEIRLPEEAMKRHDALKGLCAMSDPPRKTRHPTQKPDSIVLAKYHCKRKTIKRHTCLDCTRLPAA
jgi:hypothetical protein